MSDRCLLQESLHSAMSAANDPGPCLTRRTTLLSALVAGLPLAFSDRRAEASPIDPKETIVVLPEDMKWAAWSRLPPHSGEMATLYGDLDKPGPYVVLTKWYPGFMSGHQAERRERDFLLALFRKSLCGRVLRRLGTRADGPLATITASLVYASSSASTYQGILAGKGNTLTLDNLAALLILSRADNSFTGGTFIEAGRLEITNKGALPVATANLFLVLWV